MNHPQVINPVLDTVMPKLAIGDFILHFEIEEPGRLPAFAGSAWRGALGHALKRAVCVTREKSCSACMLYRTCAYPYLFETPPPADSAKMKHYAAAPHPFVLRMINSPDQIHYQLGLIVVDRAVQYFPYLVHALTQAGIQGLGSNRRIFSLLEVQQKQRNGDYASIYKPGSVLNTLPFMQPELPEVPARIRVRLLSPLRIRRDDHYVTPGSFSFKDLFSVLLRRISLLTYFHTATPLETDFADLTRKAALVNIEDAQLFWQDWTRFSSRQKTTMEMGGLLGSFELEVGSSFAEFWPYLWIGQWVHAGKGATMGLGQYHIECMESL